MKNLNEFINESHSIDAKTLDKYIQDFKDEEITEIEAIESIIDGDDDLVKAIIKFKKVKTKQEAIEWLFDELN